MFGGERVPREREREREDPHERFIMSPTDFRSYADGFLEVGRSWTVLNRVGRF